MPHPFESSHKELARRWAQWQPPQWSPLLEGKNGKGGKALPQVDLAAFDPAAEPFSLGDKVRDKAEVEALAVELDALQDLFYADRRFKLLVVLQGTDAAGKDGTIRTVFGRMSALGVHAVGWQAPVGAECTHDYLWRIHQRVPGAGEFTVFNRSHYEDVLVPVVSGAIDAAQHRERLLHINDFERLLSETGTVVLKFMLHISAEEQRRRLQERIDDPTKRWKFKMDDVDARKHWAEYQQAYAQLLAATHTPWAPWTIVPADSKTHRNLMVATVLREVLRNLDLHYPPDDPALAHFKVK